MGWSARIAETHERARSQRTRARTMRDALALQRAEAREQERASGWAMIEPS